ALDQDRALADGDASDRLVDLRHRARVAHERDGGRGVRRGRAGRVRLGLQLLDGALQGELDLVELEGLGDVLEGAGLHGVDRGVHRAEPGHHDDLRPGVAPAEIAKDVQPARLGHADVGQHDVERLLAATLQGLLAAVGFGDLVPPLAEDFLQHEAVFAVILDEEDPDVLHRIPGAPGASVDLPPAPRPDYRKMPGGFRPTSASAGGYLPITWLICFFSSRNLSLMPYLLSSNFGSDRSRLSRPTWASFTSASAPRSKRTLRTMYFDCHQGSENCWTTRSTLLKTVDALSNWNFSLASFLPSSANT